MTAVQTVQNAPTPANPRAHWPVELQQELEDNRFNPIVGSVLVSETDKVRVWHLMVPPASAAPSTATCSTTSGPATPTARPAAISRMAASPRPCTSPATPGT